MKNCDLSKQIHKNSHAVEDRRRKANNTVQKKKQKTKVFTLPVKTESNTICRPQLEAGHENENLSQ